MLSWRRPLFVKEGRAGKMFFLKLERIHFRLMVCDWPRPPPHRVSGALRAREPRKSPKRVPEKVPRDRAAKVPKECAPEFQKSLGGNPKGGLAKGGLAQKAPIGPKRALSGQFLLFPRGCGVRRNWSRSAPKRPR